MQNKTLRLKSACCFKVQMLTNGRQALHTHLAALGGSPLPADGGVEARLRHDKLRVAGRRQRHLKVAPAMSKGTRVVQRSCGAVVEVI